MKVLWIILMLCICTASGFSQETETEIPPEIRQEYERVQGEFEHIVGNFADFFQVKQKLVYKFEHRKGKEGFAAYIIEYTCKEVQYGVTNTGDARLPYIATITLSLTRKTNRTCGDTAAETGLGLPAGWGSVALAVENAGKTACFDSKIKAAPAQIRLDFDYLDGKWKFREAVNESREEEPELPISAALGKANAPALAIEDNTGLAFNAKWLQLLGK